MALLPFLGRSRAAATLKAFVPIRKPDLKKQYDYIIVGGGSGGGHLAYRLSEDPSCKILLIEAGHQDATPFVHVPVFYFKSIGTKKYDWCFKTHGPTSGMGGRSLSWPRGKVLGGSSSLNGLLYIRGLKYDYDRWAAQGNDGWTWDEVLPHFKACEDAPFEASYRGKGGPMTILDGQHKSELAERWSEAAAEVCGVPRIRDMTDVAGEEGLESRGGGVAYFSNFKTPDGLRCSTAIPLHEVRSERKNLDILTQAEVQSLVMNNGRVEGVSFGNTEVRVAQGGEVILAAGALGSPHLLLKSGIGSAAALKRADVECRHELVGVGENLQDHLQLRPKFRVNAATLNTQMGRLVKYAVKGGIHWIPAMFQPVSWKCGLEFMFRRTGPVSMAASQVCGFVHSSPDTPAADLQFHFQPLSTTGTPAVYLDSFDAFTASVCILRPASRGRVELMPGGELRVSPEYLTAESDQKLAVRSLEVAREISQHKLLQDIGAEEVNPPEKLDIDHARRIGESIYHPAGTCKMGPSSDPTAVVDSQLRVHGLEGVRVVDCSIMPELVSGNTHAPTVMIAEKAASMLRSKA